MVFATNAGIYFKKKKDKKLFLPKAAPICAEMCRAVRLHHAVPPCACVTATAPTVASLGDQRARTRVLEGGGTNGNGGEQF